MGASLSQCTCLDTWLLSSQSALQDKLNSLETQQGVLLNNYTTLESQTNIKTSDLTKRLETLEKRLEAVEKKSNGMFFIQEELDSDTIVFHKGK